MRARAHALVAFAALALAAGCGSPFGREYEYEEQIYLGVDGSASVVIDASVAALVELRGLPLEPSVSARFDPLLARRTFESLGCQVVRIGQPWYRHGRRFIQIRVTADDVTTLGRCAALGWSEYHFTHANGAIEFTQKLGASAGGAPAVTWTGNELVAFRMHLPGKVLYHNVRLLKDNSTGETERGNILTWEQRLTDRRAGVPIDMQVRMEPQSILYRTLWLFVGSFLSAVGVLTGLIWWTIRKGRKRARKL